MSYDISKFFCIQCGKEGIPCIRKSSHKREKHHLKKLWCPCCRTEVNHVECRNDEEVYEFKEAYENGEYKEAAAESISHVRAERLG